MEQEEVVFATVSCATEYEGRTMHVQAGECWAADDPFVKTRGDMFSASAPRVRRTGPAPAERTAYPIETTTRAPGEVRPPRGLRK